MQSTWIDLAPNDTIWMFSFAPTEKNLVALLADPWGFISQGVGASPDDLFPWLRYEQRTSVEDAIRVRDLPLTIQFSFTVAGGGDCVASGAARSNHVTVQCPLANWGDAALTAGTSWDDYVRLTPQSRIDVKLNHAAGTGTQAAFVHFSPTTYPDDFFEGNPEKVEEWHGLDLLHLLGHTARFLRQPALLPAFLNHRFRQPWEREKGATIGRVRQLVDNTSQAFEGDVVFQLPKSPEAFGFTYQTAPYAIQKKLLEGPLRDENIPGFEGPPGQTTCFKIAGTYQVTPPGGGSPTYITFSAPTQFLWNGYNYLYVPN